MYLSLPWTISSFCDMISVLDSSFPCSVTVIARRIFGRASDEESFYCSVTILDDATEGELGRAIFYLLQKWRHNAIKFLMSVHNKRTFVMLARTPPKTSCGNVSDYNQPPSGNLKKQSNISPFFGLSLILWVWVQAAIFFSCLIFVWFVYVIKKSFSLNKRWKALI